MSHSQLSWRVPCLGAMRSSSFWMRKRFRGAGGSASRGGSGGGRSRFGSMVGLLGLRGCDPALPPRGGAHYVAPPAGQRGRRPADGSAGPSVTGIGAVKSISDGAVTGAGCVLGGDALLELTDAEALPGGRRLGRPGRLGRGAFVVRLHGRTP